MDTLLGGGYFIMVVILTIALSYYWYQTHVVISTGVEGEAWGCMSTFISMLIVSIIITTIFFTVLINFWPYLLGLGAIALVIGIASKYV